MHYLTRQRMNSMGGVSDEDGAGPDVSVRVTKPQGERGTVGNTLVRIDQSGIFCEEHIDNLLTCDCRRRLEGVP